MLDRLRFPAVQVNGKTGSSSGNFAEDVVVNKQITLLVQAGPTTFNSLADSVAGSVIDLSVDSASNPITLTVGAGNANTTVLAALTRVTSARGARVASESETIRALYSTTGTWPTTRR